MDYKLSPDESAGVTPLTPVGAYDNCLIDDVIEHEIDKDGPYFKPGQVCDLEIKFQCPDKPEVNLTKYITIKLPVHSMSAYFGLLDAVASEGLGKPLTGDVLAEKIATLGARDLIGSRVNIYVMHKPKPNSTEKYANFAYLPALKK